MACKSLCSITVSDIESLGISRDAASTFHQRLTEIIGVHGAGSPATWQNIASSILNNPELPFSFHQMLYYGCFKDYGPDPPAWIPDPKSAALTNVGRLLERRGKEFLGSAYKDPITSFSDFQKFSVSNPEVYWETVFEEMNISFSKPPECILRDNLPGEDRSSLPSGQWLPGASINPAQNCLNVNGNRSLNDTVIIWRDELHDDLPLQRMTLQELRQEIWLVAYALESLGLEKGSAIAIDMPMNCKAVVIYLAIILAGYVVVSIADSFAAREISTRLRISNAKVIFTQDIIIRGDKSLPLYRSKSFFNI